MGVGSDDKDQRISHLERELVEKEQLIGELRNSASMRELDSEALRTELKYVRRELNTTVDSLTQLQLEHKILKETSKAQAEEKKRRADTTPIQNIIHAQCSPVFHKILQQELDAR